MVERESFGSKFAVIMAFAGSAIGLGNIWRFPYIAGEGGGAVFVLMFILATLLLSLPIFLAESVIGRRSGSNCLGAMDKLAKHKAWKIFGALCVFTPLFILSYYCVVGGWSLEFLFKSLTFSFTGSAPDAVSGMFGEFMSRTWEPVILFTIFLALVCIIPAMGVTAGIEKFSKYSIPVLFLIIVAVAVYSMSLPGASAGMDYLLKPDFSKLSARTVANAVGQSFYSLSLGMGIIITYSSYIKKNDNLVSSAAGTSIADLAFSILAGLAIMPAVFAAGIQPDSGPGLIFQTLPYIFCSMGESMPVISAIVAILFFVTVLVAALTSSISLVEVGIAWLVEEKHISRKKAAFVCFCGIWIVGMLCVVFPAVFDSFDYIASNILMTGCALVGVIFAGWVMKKSDVRDELTNSGTVNKRLFWPVYISIKVLAPLVIISIILANILL